jgi:hypothetical protein
MACAGKANQKIKSTTFIAHSFLFDFEKVNFKKEGVLREAMQINNEWRDHVIYSLLLDDTKKN